MHLDFFKVGLLCVVGLIAWEPEVTGAPPEGVLLRVVHAVAGHSEVVARLDLREEQVPSRKYAGQHKTLGEDPATVPPAPRVVERLCDALVNQAVLPGSWRCHALSSPVLLLASRRCMVDACRTTPAPPMACSLARMTVPPTPGGSCMAPFHAMWPM